MPGETVATGADPKCCGLMLTTGVYSSAAGYYIGYWCCECGPYSRESGYYKTRADAEKALKSGRYDR